ncbi:MAG: hypothetical protein GKR89_28395 [Candidatus Latescibacteria bacterium]|nr:hypothetical protein [Candidatus Latescibacterota bacterium]
MRAHGQSGIAGRTRHKAVDPTHPQCITRLVARGRPDSVYRIPQSNGGRSFRSQRRWHRSSDLTNDGGLEIDGVKFRYGSGAWSPDGRRIVYSMRTQSGDLRDIWLMNADGTNRVNLTNTDSRIETKPVWSPDGRQIAYYAIENGLPIFGS